MLFYQIILLFYRSVNCQLEKIEVTIYCQGRNCSNLHKMISYINIAKDPKYVSKKLQGITW